MMKKRHLVPLTAALAGALAVPAALAAPASAVTVTRATAASDTGTTSLAEVLLADGDEFDGNWQDYDILTQAVLAVLAATPDSPVKVLTQGDVALTAFLPSDRAFQALAKDLTKRGYGTEQKVFDALVAAVGVDTIEQVLLYHVIPGATIDSKTALKSDNTVLTTALPGATIKVDVLSRFLKLVQLKDADPNDVNAFLNYRALDINKGNVQVAHGVTSVMRPADL